MRRVVATRPHDGDWRLLLLLGLAAAAAAALLALPPIPQDPAYHRLADARSCLGVPNCLNVLSNLPFVAVGLAGLGFLLGRGRASTGPGEHRAYLVFFAGILLTGLGSAYYHLGPGDGTLFWDRLPLAAVFPSLLAAVIAERIDAGLGRRLVIPLAALGVASVVLWHWGQARGAGDLRLYAFVQFYPLLALPLILWLFPPRHTRSRDLAVVVAWYAVAKLAELGDAQVLAAGQLLSGHTLKHLLAAGGAAWVLRMLGRRQPLP